tara:strand:+ start:260 stop:592 length:333 start_codon:yes stop_codon:yes gene_type:complete
MINVDNLTELVPVNLHQLGIEDSETEDMTDQKYLEMSNHFKQLIDEKEAEYSMMNLRLLHDKQILMKCYGIMSLIEDFIGKMDLDQMGVCMALNLEYLNTQIREHLDINE